MDCNIIKDLIPLHIENLASEQSKKLVLEHVENCEDCKQTLAKLQSDILDVNKKVESGEIDKIPEKLVKKIKKSIYEKILISISITLIVVFFIGIFFSSTFILRSFLFFGSVSLFSFISAIFISFKLSRKNPSLRKQFRVMGNWTFVYSILISVLLFSFVGLFSNTAMIVIILILITLYNLILSLTLRIYARYKLSRDDIAGVENPKSKKLFLITISTLIIIVSIITVPISILESNRKVDDVNLPFENDYEVRGKWTVVDYVYIPEDFNPENQLIDNKSFMKEITFLENGFIKEKINSKHGGNDEDLLRPWLSWTKNYVMHNGGDKTASKYYIEEIDGTKYMFLEVKGSSYVYFNKKPTYCVLKKVDFSG